MQERRHKKKTVGYNKTLKSFINVRLSAKTKKKS